jgi:putative mRNA 3-end processing factor
MFHFDQGLFLTRLGLAIDVPRRQQWGYVSHAHADHIAPHARVMATPPTLAILHQRLQKSLTVDTLEFGKALVRDGVRLTPLPAGHILGATMLYVEHEEASCLITGDYSLENSRTAGCAEPVKADVLIMECTFGDPDFRLPPREQTVERLVETAARLLRLGSTPLIRTYVVGKSQELIRVFTDAGLPVAVHPEIATYAKIYEEFGCAVGEYVVCTTEAPADHILLYPPAGARQSRPKMLPASCEEIAVTGWVAQKDHPRNQHAKYRYPLSDHADYNGLLETIERVQPKRIYCYHGYRTFVDDLCSQGHDAHWLPECQAIQ